MNDSSAKPLAGDRLAKVIARAGLCSRREAERWIAEGRVKVDGKIVRTPAFNVTGAETVLVDNAPLAERRATRVWLCHKPVGLVVTENDPEGRPTIFEALEKNGLPRVLTIGRLDINTEGLLLLTNDGGLKRILELPSTGWLRKYRVRAYGAIKQDELDKLKKGVTIDGISYGPIEATLERAQGHNTWMVVALREGKNREIKNVLGALGLQVNRLIRISYGPFQLGDLPVGAVSVVKSRILKEQLGDRLALTAGVDFSSPLPEDDAPPLFNPNVRLRKRFDAPGSAAPKPRGRTAEPAFAKKRIREELPAHGGRNQPQGRDRHDDAPPDTRKVHYDDGREAVPFEATVKPKRPGRDGERKPAGDRPRGARPSDDRPRSRKSFEDKPGARKSFGDKPRERKPVDERPRSARSSDDKPRDRRPVGGKPGERKPAGKGPGARKPFGDKPARHPTGDRKGPPRPGGARNGPPRSGGPRRGPPGPRGPK